MEFGYCPRCGAVSPDYIGHEVVLEGTMGYVYQCIECGTRFIVGEYSDGEVMERDHEY